MSESIHGHEVMKMMIESKKTWSNESLITAIHEHFGADACFHTCSASALSAAGIVDFFRQRGKFIDSEGGFTTDSSKICAH